MVGDDDGVGERAAGCDGSGAGGLGHGHIGRGFVHRDSDGGRIIVGIRIGCSGGDNSGVGDAAAGGKGNGAANEDSCAFTEREAAQAERTGPGLESCAAISGILCTEEAGGERVSEGDILRKVGALVGDDDGVGERAAGGDGSGAGGLGHGHISSGFVHRDSDGGRIIVRIRIGCSGGDNGGVGDAAAGGEGNSAANEDGRTFTRREAA